MKIIKSIFSLKSENLHYRSEIMKFVVTLIVSISFLIGIYFLPDHISFRILAVIIIALMLYFCLAFICRLIDISENNHKNNFYIGKVKFDYKPIFIDKQDLTDWLLNCSEPEVIYLNGIDNMNHIIEVVFDVRGQRGPYYNKCIYVDDEKKTNDSVKEFISNISYPNGIKILASFDGDSPQVIKKRIDSFKSNSLK